MTLNKFYSESACRAEQSSFNALTAKGSEGAGVENMKAFARTVTCDSLRPLVASAVERFTVEAARRAATAPNSPQLVLAAQTELVRLGCTIPGKPNGSLNAETKSALARFMTVKGRPSDNLAVTEALVVELTKQTDRVCPAPAAPEKPAATSRRKDNEDSAPAKPKPQPEKRQAEREKPRPAAPPPEPRARIQAIVRPSGGGGGGGGGGGNTMIGVGF